MSGAIQRNAWLRLAVFGGLGLALYVAMQLTIGFVANHVSKSERPVAIMLGCLIASGFGVFVYHRAIRRTENRVAKELPVLPDRRFFSGLLIGAALLCGTQGVAMLFGASRILGYAGLSHAGPALLSSLFAGVGEEIVFRAIVFRLLAKATNTIVAVAGSALLFGGLHLLNPGATWIGCLAIAIEAGVMLSVAFAVTRDLWFPIGIHLGWNFFEGGVFGSAVSAGAAHGIFTTSYAGPVWLTGGSFGLEASLTATLLCTAASIAMIARRRGLPAL